MSLEKRILLFLALSFALTLGSQLIVSSLWPRKPPAGQPEQPVARAEAARPEAPAPPEAGGRPDAPASAPATEGPGPTAAPTALAGQPPAVDRIDPRELVIGSLAGTSESGYRLEVQFNQRGAGIERISSALFKAESPDNKPPRDPLQLVASNPLAAPAFSLTIPYDGEGTLKLSTRQLEGKILFELVDAEGLPRAFVQPDADQNLAPLVGQSLGIRGISRSVEGFDQPIIAEIRRIDPLDLWSLDRRPWEVVRDAESHVVRPIQRDGKLIGEEILFRLVLDDPAVTITRAYRLLEGSDSLEMTLSFTGTGSKPQAVTYQILGPHGVPIEGEWYTGTFRDVFVAQADGAGTVLKTLTAKDVAQAAAPERFQALPLRYAGVENQYFAVFFSPKDMPRDPQARWDSETTPVVIDASGRDLLKADVSVRMRAKPIVLEPSQSRSFTYQIYAGPKTLANLAAYGAEDLASYRKGQLPIFGPLGSTLARGVIAPLLDRIYAMTAAVARLFGGSRGNYGIAIILLTVIVRLCLFPLSRKQAIMAQKMQAIQPILNELKVKYKDDKERFAREMMEVQRAHGVNMFGGCLPALIQLPIFIGLWQALNNSVALRQAPFLWIKNLAAPDMLFKFPAKIPLIGDLLGPYFNILPLFVIGLMLVQMRMFSPPATTEEQRIQQKTMTWMMVLIGFMFYKVPAGLGIYFITSSTWALAERLLLPKTLKPQLAAATAGAAASLPSPKPARKAGETPTSAQGNGKRGGSWKERMLEQLRQIQEEAEHTRTHRNEGRAAPSPPDAAAAKRPRDPRAEIQKRKRKPRG
jgi:YidC/Oxa1 family membrane protein insertase